MRILGLDVSTKTGWALLIAQDREVEVASDDGQAGIEVRQDCLLEDIGRIDLGKPVAAFGPYPWSYVYASRYMAEKLTELVVRKKPDVIVVEETNGGGRASGMTQKLLEFLHNALLSRISDQFNQSTLTPPVFYLRSSEWREAIDLKRSAEDKKNNKKVSQIKAALKAKAKRNGTKFDRKEFNAKKKEAGVGGKIGWKHLSVAWANTTYGLQLKMKENDQADAIGLATGFAMGCQAQLEEVSENQIPVKLEDDE